MVTLNDEIPEVLDMGNKFVVVDLETTGNSVKKGARIIQIGAVIIENGKISGQYSSLVNPGTSIPAFIEELTGINDQMVKDAPTFDEIAPVIMELLDDAYFVAHNVLFDLGFLQEELQNAGLEGFFGSVIDTVELARILFPTAEGYKLSDLAAKEGISHDRPHQADSDAYVTAELLLIMLKKLDTFPFVTIKGLAKLSADLKSDIYLLLDELVTHKQTVVEELSQDIEVFRDIALKQRRHLVPYKNNFDKNKLSYPAGQKEKEEILQKVFPDFEQRLGQFEMMDCVHQSFSYQQCALIEAGTGIGKTLGYLIPAILFSMNNNERVVISTYTTQLQQQILMNDLPKLMGMFDFPIKTVLLKGKDHYINLARFELSLRKEDDNYDTTLTKMQILVWLMETETGDYEELNLSSGGLLYWNKIKNTPVSYLQSREWDERDFYLKAHKDAEDANLIITNHSMLLTDLVSNDPFIPTYEYVILDEAHHFEQTAGKHFGKALDYLAVRLTINQFGQYEQGQLFKKLEDLLTKSVGKYECKYTKERLNTLINDVQYEIDVLFMNSSSYAKKNKSPSSASNKVQSILPHGERDRMWQALFGSAERLSFLLRDLHLAIEERFTIIENKRTILHREDKVVLDEINTLKKEIERIRGAIREVFLYPNQNLVRWIETDLRSVQNLTTVFARPAYVSERLQKEFFTTKKSVVMTSATLTVNHSFKFIKAELGIDSLPVIEKRISSPFNFGEQVQLIVPNDLPDIKSSSEAEYISAITEHIISIAEVTKGRMLTLFTSHEMLKKTYELIKESSLLDEYVLIAQGISGGSRGRLVRNFQRFEKAILFGTSSFWEGIDIPGENLSCLIIVRLPFSPPDEPLAVAKHELIVKDGGNPFYELALPEAVLRFKQGFGRLIRSSTDRGIVFVFDRRILTTSYGKFFLQSIPPVSIKKLSIDEIVYFVNKWL